jgi:hypothetical protein
MHKLLLLILLLLPLASSAQIYKTTDKQGNVTYSDTPPNGTASEEVQLQQVNTTPPPPDRPKPLSRPAPEEPAATDYQLTITAPPNETTIPMGPGNFSVSATVSPSLAQGRLLQLYLDGSPWGDPQASTSWSLTNVLRGAHDLTVGVIDTEDTQLASSEPVRVYVLRPSINFKNRN